MSIRHLLFLFVTISTASLWADDVIISQSIHECRKRLDTAGQHRRLIPGLNVAIDFTTGTEHVFNEEGRKVPQRFMRSALSRNNNTYNLLEVSDSPELETLRFHHRDGVVPSKGIVSLIPEGKGKFEMIPVRHGKGQSGPAFTHATQNLPVVAHMPAFHGAGGLNSQGGSWFDFMNLVMSSSIELNGLSTELKQLPFWVPITVESIDLPGYASGLPLEDFLDPEAMVDYSIKWLEMIRRTSNLPIIPVGRSASSGILAAIAEKRPDLVDALIIISPVHPVVGLLRNQEEAYRHGKATGEFIVESREARLKWLRKKLEQDIVQPINSEWSVEHNADELEKLIHEQGGFPGTSESDRLEWVGKMAARKLFVHPAPPGHVLETLGHLPGGTEDQQRAWYDQKRRKGDFIPNFAGLDTCFHWYKTMQEAPDGSPLAWHRNQNGFNGVPTLVLMGDDDWQVPDGRGRLANGDPVAPTYESTNFVRQHGISPNMQLRIDPRTSLSWVYHLNANGIPTAVWEYNAHEDVRQAYRELVDSSSHPLTDLEIFQHVSHDVVSLSHPSVQRSSKQNRQLTVKVYSRIFRFVHDVIAYRSVHHGHTHLNPYDGPVHTDHASRWVQPE